MVGPRVVWAFVGQVEDPVELLVVEVAHEPEVCCFPPQVHQVPDVREFGDWA